jgi:zinc transport system permease protein
MTNLAVSSLALSAAVALAAGLVGSFALMRRMSLAADALSHVALPGIGVAILLRVNVLAGALVALIGGVLLIWALERGTRLAADAIVGVVFSSALAVGALLTTSEELIDALFGGATTISRWELAAGFAGAFAVIAFVVAAKDRLLVTFVSADIARTSGIGVRRLDLLYLLACAVTVALGLRYLGALLMGSLMIIPAATARQAARNLRQMLTLSATLAVGAMLAGTVAGARLHRESGPLVVAAASACFFAALSMRPRSRAARP